MVNDAPLVLSNKIKIITKIQFTMQTVLSYLMLVVTGMVMQAQNTIEISMTNFDHNNGHVMVSLYNDETKFLNTPFKSIKAEIIAGKAVVTFTDTPEGIYAVSCYHDEDDDGSLNMIMGMIPSEPYGTSNNARGFFGPPKWEDAKFVLKEGERTKLEIQM